MPIDPWLPIGYHLPDGAKARAALHGAADWQIVETAGRGRALLVKPELADRWISSGLIADGVLSSFAFGELTLRVLVGGSDALLAPVDECPSPSSKAAALAFALALKATRAIDGACPLQDAIYVEALSRVLPTYGISERLDDDIVLGAWLTGGAMVSVQSFRRLNHLLGWMPPAQIKGIVDAAGLTVREQAASDWATERSEGTGLDGGAPFRLPGRPQLESFLNEHVVDIIRNGERYKALGIGFPSAIILHGPPGCGKTFAVEKLVQFLGWPSFEIDASSIGSPFIHETSRKIADIFEKAMASAPAALVIDEMESFLADRDMGASSSHHRVEEVAEFLRRIPEAAENHVLIVAMTNRIDMIDPAVLRRGRFDHVIKLDYATEAEVSSLLETLIGGLPREGEIDCGALAKRLAGRPLSDVAFVVREGARLAARAGGNALNAESLVAALKSAPSRTGEAKSPIGFQLR
jgi:hypothetical protein